MRLIDLYVDFFMTHRELIINLMRDLVNPAFLEFAAFMISFKMMCMLRKASVAELPALDHPLKMIFQNSKEPSYSRTASLSPVVTAAYSREKASVPEILIERP